MSKQKNLQEINDSVQEGLEKAKQAASNEPDLLRTIRDLETTWDHVCSQLIVLSVGLSAIKYRTDDQITAQIRDYKNKIEEAKSTDFMSRFKYSGAMNN